MSVAPSRHATCPRDLIETVRRLFQPLGQSRLAFGDLERPAVRNRHPRKRLGNHEPIP